jgi:restriction endonuclease S subunit
LSATLLRQFEVPMPPMHEQLRISTALDALDRRLASIADETTALNHLFASALAALFRDAA